MHALLHKYSIMYPKIIKQINKRLIGKKKKKYRYSGVPVWKVLKNSTHGSIYTKTEIGDNKNKTFNA